MHMHCMEAGVELSLSMAPAVVEALATLAAFHKDATRQTLSFPANRLSPEQVLSVCNDTP
eukprot:COSAG05_NODE_2081_length_3599_cov_2.701143_4_plen_60_part_00